MDSIKHAIEDIAARALAESRTEAMQLIDTTEKFMQKNKASLTEDELRMTQSAIDDLKIVIQSSDKDIIHQKTEALNEISRPYAERVLDDAISKVMSGKNIKDAI